MRRTIRKAIQFSPVLPHSIQDQTKWELAVQHTKLTDTQKEGGQEKSREWGRGAEGSREPCTLISEMRWEGRGAWCSQARGQPLRSPRAAGSGPWARSTRLTAAFTSLLMSAVGQRENRKGVTRAAPRGLTMPTRPQRRFQRAESHLPNSASSFLPVHFWKRQLVSQPLPTPYL